MDIGNLFFSEFSKDESESKTDGCEYTPNPLSNILIT